VTDEDDKGSNLDGTLSLAILLVKGCEVALKKSMEKTANS